MTRDQVIEALSKGVQDFIDQLQMFKNQKVAWVTAKDDKEDYGKLYVRRSQRLINRKITQCMDLGAIEVSPDLQGQGIMSAMLELLEKVNPWGTVYVENVMDEHIADALRRRGYITDDSKSNEDTTCLYKVRKK